VVLDLPSDLELDIPGDCLVVSDPSDAARARMVVNFVVRAGDLDDAAGPAIAGALEDRLAWIAYPKARQLGTDLNGTSSRDWSRLGALTPSGPSRSTASGPPYGSAHSDVPARIPPGRDPPP
jgi:hypothetical protein